MPTVRANNININYESTGQGEPMVLIPYLAADQACYAFQVADYSKHFTCISVDLRGAGLSDKPNSPYSTELFADDIAAFMQAIGVERAHISGLSLGASVGMWLAAKHPEKVKSLSLHSSWPKTDPFLKTCVEGWRVIAQGLDSVPEMIILGIFPWCFTPGLYASKPDYIESLAAFVRSRPAQPLDAFMRMSDASSTMTRHPPSPASKLRPRSHSAATTWLRPHASLTFCITRSKVQRCWSSRTARMPQSTKTCSRSTTRRWPSYRRIPVNRPAISSFNAERRRRNGSRRP
jgi:pimeloyl-ACP methyl ester carboxylesterase